jgi:hypothetical protein
MSVLLWALWLVAQGVGARNVAEEAICQPFLTSHTSPLLPGPRDLAADEDGEFACGLVLQDVMLPVQIRATVHEVRYRANPNTNPTETAYSVTGLIIPLQPTFNLL